MAQSMNVLTSELRTLTKNIKDILNTQSAVPYVYTGMFISSDL